MKRVPIQRRRQRGVASLVVVMVLFFIVSLVAAYASRNLIFEQRTSANQYRSTQAIEAAEAGVEWALAMLNHGRITDACATSTVDTNPNFRQRYLNIDTDTGNITVRKTSTNTDLLPSCVFDGTNRACSCPTDGSPVLSAPTGNGVYPAFRVRFVTLTGSAIQPGLVRIEAIACTRLADDCLNFLNTVGAAPGLGNEGRAYASVLVGLTGGAVSPPAATLTALGNVTLAGGAIYGDVPVQYGGTTVSIDPSLTLSRAAGTPGSAVPVQSSALHDLGTSRTFAAVFNMWSDTYRAQPGAVVLNCSVVTCNASAVRDAVRFNPGRPLWVNGDLSIDSAGDIGSAATPVLIVVTGQLNTSVTTATIHGLVYVQTASWLDTGTARVQGAVVVEGDVATGSPVLAYDTAVLNVLHLTNGSFVRVPGSWRDFP